MVNFEKVFLCTLTAPEYCSRKIIVPGVTLIDTSAQVATATGWKPRHLEYRTEHIIEASDPVVLTTLSAIVYATNYRYTLDKKAKFPDTELYWVTQGDLVSLYVTMRHRKAEPKKIQIHERVGLPNGVKIRDLVCEDGMVIESPDMTTLCRLIHANSPNLCWVEPCGQDLHFCIRKGNYPEYAKDYFSNAPRDLSPSELQEKIRDQMERRENLERVRRKELKEAYGKDWQTMDDFCARYTPEALENMRREENY